MRYVGRGRGWSGCTRGVDAWWGAATHRDGAANRSLCCGVVCCCTEGDTRGVSVPLSCCHSRSTACPLPRKFLPFDVLTQRFN